MHKAWWLALASALGALLFLGLTWQLHAARAADANLTAILIDAVLYDGYAFNDEDEAVRLVNVGAQPVDIGGWRLSDGVSVATLPAGTGLPPGETLWLARSAAAFTFHFGFAPGIVLPSWPGFANSGDEVFLTLPNGLVVDGLVYGAGNVEQSWWHGPAVQPYKASNLFAAEGQILYRRSDPLSGARVADSDAEPDWAQTAGDPVAGRKVQYPGWELDRFYQPLQITETATITTAIAPDNAFSLWLAAIEGAGASIAVESFTFEHAGLATALAAAAQRGVHVEILLEGSPVGGVTNQQRWACQQVELAGGACWFMIRDDSADIHDRYRYIHAKFMVVDGDELLVSSENLSPNSLPDDDKSDGTWGRRGLVLATNAPSVVNRAAAIFADDLDPDHHADLRRWQPADPVYGAPPPGFVPVTVTGGVTYTVRFPTPLVLQGVFPFELVQAPESSLHWNAGVLGLIARAGAGDEVLAQQLSEPAHWGAASSSPASDPNPRLEALLDAARRGARVRLLLDSFFDDGDNAAACAYANGVAESERLNFACAQANPAGLGLHNKMILVRAGGQGWVHAGSLNGTEQAHKNNRELAIQVQSDELYAYLRKLFEGDWPYFRYLPLVLERPLSLPTHVLISEVVYDPHGSDAAEFIELVNPLGVAFDLSNWYIGDAVLPSDFEDLRRFPEGTVLAPHATLVIAFSAVDFRTQFGRSPDFEIIDSDPLVPDLPDEPGWGNPAALLQLGNTGDEVLLRSPTGAVIDGMVYGDGSFFQMTSCPLLPAAGYSLERYPYWQDTDHCPADFRAWPLPNPGELSPTP